MIAFADAAMPFKPLGFGAKARRHGVSPTHSEAIPRTLNIWAQTTGKPLEHQRG